MNENFWAYHFDVAVAVVLKLLHLWNAFSSESSLSNDEKE